MEIRKARASDAEGLAALYLQFWKAHGDADPMLRLRKKPDLKTETLQAKKDIRRRNCMILLALESGRVLGFIELLIKKNDAIFRIKEYGYLNSLVIDEKHRKKGIARRLTREGLLHLRKKGLRYVKLNVYCSNRPALAVWRKLGFREISKNMLLKL